MISKIQQLFGKENSPDWNWYPALKPSLPVSKTPIDKIPFVVMDIESTGLNPKEDKILSIGAIPCFGKQIRTDLALEIKIRQEFYRSETIAIHEILPSLEKENKIEEKQALIRFLKTAGNAVWVGHFSAFDFQILKETASRHGLYSLHNPVLDTSKLLVRADSYYRNPDELKKGELTLSAICKKLNLPIEEEHTAIGDALSTSFLFVYLISELRKRGIRNWKDLRRSCI